MMSTISLPKKQNGAAVLLTAVILLIASTIIVLFSGRVTLFEHKISGNDARSKIASARADEGLNVAISRLKELSPPERTGLAWQSCTDGDDAPCGDNFNSTWSYVEAPQLGNDCTEQNEQGYCARYFTTTPDLNYASITIVSEGHADNGNAQSLATQTVSKYNFFANTVGRIPPIMTPVPTIGGNMTVIPNPNANGIAGQSNPISVWSSDPMAFNGAGSMQTCGALFDNGGDVGAAQCIEPGENGDLDEVGRPVPTTFNQCNCSDVDVNYSTGTDDDGRRRPYSTKDDFGTDVVDNDDGFPDDMFQFFFNTPSSNWQNIKDIAKVYDSCNNDPDIDDDTSPGDIIWIQGDCKITGPTFDDDQLGSRFTDNGGRGPVIMVVEGDFEVSSSGIHIWGIVFVINEAGVSNPDSTVTMTGGPYIHGALLADKELDFGGGSMTVMYDADMLRAVAASEDNEVNVATDRWLPLTGSWSDMFPVSASAAAPTL